MIWRSVKQAAPRVWESVRTGSLGWFGKENRKFKTVRKALGQAV